MAYNLHLEELSSKDKYAYYEMLEDFLSNGEDIDDFEIGYESEDFEMLLRRLQENKLGIGLKKGFAPNSTYYLRSEDRNILGFFNLRHSLSPELRRDGGHIGYAVRPSSRGQGYSHEILRLGLEIASQKKMRKLMLSVASQNIRSIAVIEKQNGILEGENLIGRGLSRNYWIHLN